MSKQCYLVKITKNLEYELIIEAENFAEARLKAEDFEEDNSYTHYEISKRVCSIEKISEDEIEGIKNFILK